MAPWSQPICHLVLFSSGWQRCFGCAQFKRWCILLKQQLSIVYPLPNFLATLKESTILQNTWPTLISKCCMIYSPYTVFSFLFICRRVCLMVLATSRPFPLLSFSTLTDYMYLATKIISHKNTYSIFSCLETKKSTPNKHRCIFSFLLSHFIIHSL